MKIKAWHGTNTLFKEFRQDKARIMNDFYGGGVAYFTDNEKVARTYAISNSKSGGGTPYIYEVELTLDKVFDVDSKFTGKDLTQFLKGMNSTKLKDFASSARLAKIGDDIHVVMGRLQSGRYTLDGDTVFKALSRGMNQTANARDTLKNLGYDALRYNGGHQMSMAIKHSVYCVYYAKDIKIKRIYTIKKKSTIKEEIEIPPSPINISRNDMPQLNPKAHTELLRRLNIDCIPWRRTTRVVSQLTPSQGEFNVDKVESMMGNLDNQKPIIISSEGYIIDGHHRWLAEYNTDKNSDIDVIVISMPFNDLISYIRRISLVDYKSVTETIKRVIRGKLLTNEI